MFATKLEPLVLILLFIITPTLSHNMQRTNDEILTDFMKLDPASPTFDLDFLGVLINKASNQTVPETTLSSMSSTLYLQQSTDEIIM